MDLIASGTASSSSSSSGAATTLTTTNHFNHSNGNSNNNNMNSSNLNLAATHNGFGLHNHSLNQASHHQNNHFSSASVLTYRSNRRSIDRSENKLNDVNLTQQPIRNTLNSSGYNESISSRFMVSRSFINMFLRFIYKTFMFICCGINKRRTQTSSTVAPEQYLPNIVSILKQKLIGRDSQNYNETDISEPTLLQQIDRIDDDCIVDKVSASDPSISNIPITTPPLSISATNSELSAGKL